MFLLIVRTVRSKILCEVRFVRVVCGKVSYEVRVVRGSKIIKS